MLTSVLDASAYLRFVLHEAGESVVAAILEEQKLGTSRAIMSAIQWGEVVKVVTLRRGPQAHHALALYLAQIGFEIIPATADRAEKSALIGLKYNVSYADAFGIELALDSPDHILVTADYGVKPAESIIRIEFLPTKPKP